MGFRKFGLLALLGFFFADHLLLNVLNVGVPFGLFFFDLMLDDLRLGRRLGLLLAFLR